MFIKSVKKKKRTNFANKLCLQLTMNSFNGYKATQDYILWVEFMTTKLHFLKTHETEEEQ